MPTAARLFAAIGFATAVFFASEFYKFLLPEGYPVGLLSMVNSVIGFLAGWLVMGRLAGQGYYRAAGSGLRTMFVAVFYIMIVWSLYEMLKRSLRKVFDGPMEALKAMAELITEYVALGAVDPQVAITVVVGGVLAAFFSEWASHRFR